MQEFTSLFPVLQQPPDFWSCTSAFQVLPLDSEREAESLGLFLLLFAYFRQAPTNRPLERYLIGKLTCYAWIILVHSKLKLAKNANAVYLYYIKTKKHLPAGTEISLFQSTAEHSLIAVGVLSFSAFHSFFFFYLALTFELKSLWAVSCAFLLSDNHYKFSK